MFVVILLSLLALMRVADVFWSLNLNSAAQAGLAFSRSLRRSLGLVPDPRPTAGKVNRNCQTNNDTSVLSVTPVDSLLFEARLNDVFCR